MKLNCIQSVTNCRIASIVDWPVRSGLEFAHKLLFTCITTGCDTAVSVVQHCGDAVSGFITAINRLRVAETRTYAF